jgi:hypothetical protein
MKIKKAIFLLFLFFFSSSLYSQEKKPNVFLVQGLVNPLSSLKTKNDFTLQADMRVGYLIKRNLVMGLNFETSLWKSKDDYFMQTIYLRSSIKLKGELNMYSGGYFIRYYFHRGKFVFFPETGFGGALLNWEYDVHKKISGEEKYVYVKYGFGINYFILDNVALEFLVSYRKNDIGYMPLSYYYPRERLLSAIGLSIFIR